MLVVDASALYEVITEGKFAEKVREILLSDTDLAAPQLIDTEVMGLLRRDTQSGVLHESRSAIAIEELVSWPDERFTHRLFNQRCGN